MDHLSALITVGYCLSKKCWSSWGYEGSGGKVGASITINVLVLAAAISQQRLPLVSLQQLSLPHSDGLEQGLATLNSRAT